MKIRSVGDTIKTSTELPYQRKEFFITKGSLQIKNNTYQAVFYYDGKTVWRSTGIKAIRGNKRKAEQRMNKILAEYEDNPTIFDKIDFTHYIKIWLNDVKNHIDLITYEGYSQYANKHIIPYFEPKKLKLQDVKLSDIESYYKYKSISGRLDGKQGGLSYRSIKLHSVVLNLVFEYAMRNKLIKENPCQFAKIPNTAKRSKKIIDFYTPEQCNKLLGITQGTILHDMILITFLYGLRRSELMGLKWDAVDFDKNTVTIQHTVVVNDTVVAKDSAKNKSSRRTYPLLDEVKDLLLKRKEEQKEYKKLFGNCYTDTAYVFTKENGNTYYPAYPTHSLRKVIEQNDLPHLRWHDLRHSTASMLLEKGWSMKDISEWLGHSNINITMDTYTAINLDRKRTLSNSLNGILDK